MSAFLQKTGAILTFILFAGLSVFAQAPEKMTYQAVIRGSNDNLVLSHNVGIRISILQGTISGTAAYVETHEATTNANGLVTLEIGTGSEVLGTFSSLDWGNGPYFLKTETDPTGGSTYTIEGTTQLLSVPYALYAKNSGNTSGIPAGGNAGQVLTKVDGTNNNTQWITPAGSSLSEYAYIYNSEAQMVPIEADINFSTNGVISGAIMHSPGTSSIMIGAAGNYEISFNVSAVEPNQFTLFINGAPVSGATYGSGAGTQQTTGMVIITASAGDVISLRNHSGIAAVTLQTFAGGTQVNANASLKILYLGN